jgi:translocation and assembly module TamB
VRRGGKRLALGVLALLAVPAVLAVLLLGTQTGSRWLLSRIPGLAVEQFQGRLGGQWQATRLTWERDGQRVQVSEARLAWSPGCLLRLTLCVDRLQAERVEIVLPATEKSDGEALKLPDLKLPLAIRLGEMRLGSLVLDGGELLSDLRLAAHWSDEGLEIERSSVVRDGLALSLRGRVRPDGAWPLELTGTLDLPAPDALPWRIEWNASGELADKLDLHATSTGYLNAQLDGELQPLAEHLPARLRLLGSSFKASAGLPDTLALDDIDLTAQGDLRAGYAVEGSARLPAEQGPLPLRLRGVVDARGARIDSLAVRADAEHSLTLDGTLGWQDGFSAETRLDWQAFPWQRLFPDIPPPAVEARHVTAELYYRDGGYLGNFTAALEGPAGAFGLASPFSGTFAQVDLPQLELRAGQGMASGGLHLEFADGIAWRAEMQLRDLDPAYLLPQLPGTLAGPLNSNGSFKSGRLALQADVRLEGQLRGQPARLNVEAQGEGERWRVAGLSLSLGANRIEGEGTLEQILGGQLRLDLPRLGQLWPGLRGQVYGRLDLAGSLEKPQGRLRLDGQALGLNDTRLAALQVNGNLDAAQRATLVIDGKQLALGDTALGDVSVQGNGDRHQQRLTVGLDGADAQAALAFDGTLEKGDWRGRIASGQLGGNGQQWRLQAPARLERFADGRLELGAQCWLSGAASLCSDDQRLQPEPRLRLRLRDFPLASLSPWLPDDFAWQGQLNADVQVDLPNAGPSGQVRVDAGSGVLRLREGDDWHDFAYRQLALDARLTPRQVDARLDFHGDELGQLLLEARIDPRPQRKPLSGRFELSGLDLAVARPFLGGIEQVEGKLGGSGSLAGTLQAPQVQGRLQLENGLLAGGDLPTRVENLRLLALIDGEQANLSGTWAGGETGQGRLDGDVRWGEGLDVDLQVRGTRLPVNVEPYAQLEVEPDLRVQLAGERLALSGKVDVPRGQVTVRNLPPSTVSVSGDTVIVGAEPQAQRGLGMAMDIDVQVGQDKLSFSGFGLNAELVGQVHVGDNLETRGELSLRNGRYRAYGQRLDIRRARLLFTGPIDQPFLDVEAVRQVDDVLAGLRLTGSAAAPTSTVFSEPAMSQEQALSYLVLGRPLNSGSEGDNNMLAQAALSLGLTGGSALSGQLASRLGIQNFQLESEGSGNATSVVASGNLSERLTLRYGVGVFEPANTIALRYQLTRRFFLEAASGLASSLDIFYKRDF